MNAGLVERQAALAAVALLAVLGSVAFDRTRKPDLVPEQERGQPPVAGQWYEAAVGTYGPGFFGRTTACGVKLTRATHGVAHPVLPCGARIVVAHGERQIDTRVVDRGPYGSGQEFALTQALANDLGVSGVKIVRWRFSPGAR